MALRLPTAVVLAATALASLPGALWAQSMRGAGGNAKINFRAAGQAQREDVQLVFAAELEDHSERMARLEDGLRIVYGALPKTDQGKLGHEAVRYALHRFFLNRNGWFIRGLEPNHKEWVPENNASFVREWVPSFIQQVLEARVGEGGAALHDVAAVAASLEDLIKKEAAARLAMVYDAHGFSSGSPLERGEATSVLMTYYMSFLVANNFTVGNYPELLKKKHRFELSYKNFTEAKHWFEDVIGRQFGPTAAVQGKRYDFKDTSAVVADISENFYSFNERECSSLRSTLSSVESRKPGRVRLSTFYNMSRYSHWGFTESTEYLRNMGALDDTDPRNPSVIIPNYAMARANCLDAFHLFTICCRNSCEDMMGNLEQQLGSHEADVGRIVEVVSALPSDSVQAPRSLPSVLVSRLGDIASHNGGKVPIHGRLFSQWMHHAYPLECPYPHTEGLNPQTAAEWMEVSGSKSTQATKEEMRRTVESDSCAVNWQGRADCEEESTELPWTMEEHLISHSANAKARPAAASSGTEAFRVILGLVCLFALIGAAVVVHRSGSELSDVLGEGKVAPQRKALVKVVVLVALAGLGHSVELIHGAVVFAIAFVAVVSSLGLNRIHRDGKSV